MYTKTKSDITKTITNRVRKLADNLYHNGAISNDLRSYMLNRNAQPGQLKGNSKLHKAGNPMRKIVSGVNTVTEKHGRGRRKGVR
jgi:hypothetical protein